ncbi:MAG: hypothetical protein ACI8ZM_001025 [Crocinitomix sp.]|jgi:hypothetical protein
MIASFKRIVEKADYYAVQKNYPKALDLYKRALSIDCCQDQMESVRDKIAALEKIKQ